jgi:hypothetical protein
MVDSPALKSRFEIPTLASISYRLVRWRYSKKHLGARFGRSGRTIDLNDH